MKAYRNERVASLIAEELSKLLLRKFDFNGALVSITKVKVDEDLSLAEVKVAILPTEKELEVYKKLEEEKNNIQKRLHHILNIKPMPQLKFLIERYDEKENDEKE